MTTYPDLQMEGNHLPRRCSPSIPVSNSHTSTALQLSGGFFDNIGKFFGDDGKENSDEAGKKPLERETTLNKQSEVDDFILNEVEEDYPGSTLIFHMKAKSMKTGGLRLWLFLNLMGQLNTPDPKTWKANQAEDKNILEMFYKDTTGAIIVKFTEDVGVSVFRFGASPSMNYMMQESQVLLGILDELDKIVYDGDIAMENRLLILEQPDAIEKARELLSFA